MNNAPAPAAETNATNQAIVGIVQHPEQGLVNQGKLLDNMGKLINNEKKVLVNMDKLLGNQKETLVQVRTLLEIKKNKLASPPLSRKQSSTSLAVCALLTTVSDLLRRREMN